MGFFYLSFNCKQFFFPIGQDLYQKFGVGISHLGITDPHGKQTRTSYQGTGWGTREPVRAGGAWSLWMRFFQSSLPSSVEVWWTQGVAFPTPLEKFCFVIRAELSISAAQFQSWHCPTQSCWALFPAWSILGPVPTWSRRAPLLTQIPCERLILAASIIFIVAVTQGAPK